MKRHNYYIGAIGVMFFTFGWLFYDCNGFAQNQPMVNEKNSEYAQLLTNAPPPGFATRMDYVKSFTRESAILDAYHSGKLNKDEAMLALAELEDKVSNDTYGKVVDQSGNPLAEVKVVGNVDLAFGDSKAYKTTTDAQGLFHFLGLRGQGLGVELEKNGYYFDYMSPSADRPNSYLPDPNNPLIFTMWKLRGAEPMVHDKLHAYIPCDGSIIKFDLLTGKKSLDGDFNVSLTRNPVSIVRSKPFAWSVTLEVTNGGLQAITNVYPNEAPAEGYQSKITFDFQPNSKEWTSHFTPKFYFKAKNGQVFGRMAINIMSDFQPPPTLFDAEIYANPGGSRNLEFDPSKQIRR